MAAGRKFDEAAKWFWGFLRNELAPYPGRAWVVARMTTASSIVMLLIMVFRLPSGFVPALFTFILSRESPTATLRSGVRIAIAATAAMVYTILSIEMMADDPLTHFLWVMGTLFLCFFAMRIIRDFGTALSFSLPIILAVTVWDANTVNVNTRISNTLWLGFLVIVGAAVTVAVEYVFRKVHPATGLTEGVESRLKTVEEILRDVGADLPVSEQTGNAISQYSGLGTSTLRRLLLRSGYSGHFIAQMSAAVALVGRLVDLAASMRIAYTGQPATLSPEDHERCLSLADNIAELREHLLAGKLASPIDLSIQERRSNLAFLSAMERTVALIPQAFSGSKTTSDFLMRAPMDDDRRERLITPDAFSNSAHLQFAVRGSLAAMVCYITYNAVDWPGLKSSIITCLLTAVSTIGSSRQRGGLRLGGFILGGLVFGMGSQVFVLPYLDSIVGFGILFALVTAIAAWITTSTPRISFLGLQLALAFNLIQLQDFTIQTSLAIARDRLVGVLLGLISMWLIFDRLWVRNALNEMQSVFARNLQMFAELTRQLLRPDRNEALKRIRQLRERINTGFAAVRAQSDAVLFEFGPSRQRKLEVREDMRRWDPSLRTLLQVQLTFSHYRLQRPLEDLPQVAEAEIAFNDDIARMIQLMADEVCGNAPGSVPDVRESAGRLEEEIRRYYTENGLPIAPRMADVISLVRNLTLILVPLYEDIHVAFASER
jgi:multidrug resistance protein MdtO